MVKVYRSMQEIDGKLYPPMSARADGELRQPTERGVWKESEENPGLADENVNFKLDKGNGKSLKAAYAPYFLSRRSPLNEQFSEAYNRPNLVIVEGEIPESELTSGYTAEKNKKSVGEHDWPSGKVSNALAKKGQDTRKVILSRWFKPVRVVPNSEVDDMIMERMGDSNISFPYNVVTQGLREELAKKGARFSGWQGNKPADVDEQIARMQAENEQTAGETRFRVAYHGSPNEFEEAPRFVDAVDGLPLVLGQADHPALVEERLHDLLADPPDGVGDEFESACGIEPARRTDQPEVALIDQVGEVEAAVLVLLGHRHHEAQVGLHQATHGLLVARLDAVRQFGLLLGRDALQSTEVAQVPLEGFGPYCHGLCDLDLFHCFFFVPVPIPSGRGFISCRESEKNPPFAEMFRTVRGNGCIWQT